MENSILIPLVVWIVNFLLLINCIWGIAHNGKMSVILDKSHKDYSSHLSYLAIFLIFFIANLNAFYVHHMYFYIQGKITSDNITWSKYQDRFGMLIVGILILLHSYKHLTNWFKTHIMIEHVLTQQDLDLNPELVSQGYKVGDIILLPVSGGVPKSGDTPEKPPTQP